MVLQVVLLFIGGQWAVGPAVEEPSDENNDEHLADHHLLTQHWTTQTNKQINAKLNKPTTNQQITKRINND